MSDMQHDGDFLNAVEMGVGNWAWGDRIFWGGRRLYSDADSRAAFEASVAAGITFVDTAEVYGLGRAERLLGQFMRESGQQVTIATKFYPMPWRWAKGAMRRALRGSLRRLGVSRVDLYQIHFPVPPRPIEFWVDALADMVQEDLTRAVGVSNYDTDQMRRAYEVLARRGVTLASNQVEYSLLHRDPEQNGLMAACEELGVRLIAYSPLAKGLLTGKYTPENLPTGLRKRSFREKAGRVQPLVARLREIGEAHGGKTPAQVALNWTIRKGVLPIPGARNAQQAEQNAGALGWHLTDEEVAVLDEASAAL